MQTPTCCGRLKKFKQFAAFLHAYYFIFLHENPYFIFCSIFALLVRSYVFFCIKGVLFFI